jgi:MoxR-like ATPase
MNEQEPTLPAGGDNPEDFQAPLAETDEFEPIVINEDSVVIMGVELDRNPEPGELTPEAKKFKDFVVDEYSLQLLQTYAKAVKLNQPMLVEGEAAVGKSYTIEYLAYLTNSEVYRTSLHGQTDTTDLIGKWIPRTEHYRQQMERLLADPSRCSSSESEEIIKNFKAEKTKDLEEIAPEDLAEGRVLDKETMMRIAELEGIEISKSEWKWQNGVLPEAIANNGWIILDEMNTCEPQILVRLNAMLEQDGQLILHEDGDRVVRPQDPDKGYRIFATTNPPGGKYRGRVPLSAEYVSRWSYHSLPDIPASVHAFRSKVRMGLSVEMDDDSIDRLREQSVGEIAEGRFSLVELFEKDWVEDFIDRYTEAWIKLRQAVLEDDSSMTRDQQQKFDFDQRDLVRFEQYVTIFAEPGNMKQVIQEAIEYCWVGKFKTEAARDQARDICDLIRVSEPKPKVKVRVEQEDLHRVVADILADPRVRKDHKEMILGSPLVPDEEFRSDDNE